MSSTALRNNTDLPVITEVTLMPGEEIRRTTSKQRDSYRDLTAFKGRQVPFTFTDMTTLDDVISALTTAQCGYLLVLQCYTDYSGVIVDSEGAPMTTADMMDALKLRSKRQTFYDFLTACLSADIIAEAGGKYTVNSRYHFRGATDSRAVIRTYTTKIREAYREVNAADLGLIYRMLPFVHFETNALCANPFESDPDKIRWFNGKELAEATGVHEDTLGRRLSRMKFGRKYVIGRFKFGGSREPAKFIFNPHVFYRRNKTPDSTLLALFNVR